MKLAKTVLAIVMFLLTGATFSLYAQDKYGSEPDKCKTNLSLFHEAIKMKNYDAAYEPWKWCLDNCPQASKVIYSDGLKMAEDQYNQAAGVMDVKKGEKIQTNDYIFAVENKYFDTSKSDKEAMNKFARDVILVYTMRVKNFPDNLGKVYSDWANFLFKRAVLEDSCLKMKSLIN